MVGIDLKAAYDKPYDPKYLYRPFLDMHRVTLLSGAPGAGKTWVLLHLAACLSSRLPWLGAKPMFEQPMSVMYLDLEMGPELVGYYTGLILKGLDIERDGIPTGLSVVCSGEAYTEGLHLPSTFALGPKGDWEKLDTLYEAASEPDVIIADPLINLVGAVEESDNRMMNAALRTIKGWREESAKRPRWFIGHHEGKYNETPGGSSKRPGQRIRGGSAIEAIVDAHMSMSMVGDGSGRRRVQFGKWRGVFEGLDEFQLRIREDDGKRVLEKP